MTIDTACTKTKGEATFQHLNNAKVEESNCIPLMELDTLNINCINFDTRIDPSNASEFLHKDINENDPVSPPESPVFSRALLKTGSNSIKKLRSLKTVCNPTSNMKTQHNIEKVPSKYNHKLELSTTHHVETTFLPNGKRLKQSRLTFCPVKSNEKMVASSNIDKHKSTGTIHNVQQNFIPDIFTTNITVTENEASEISEDIIEISPTQKSPITSKVKRCLKFKRKIPTKRKIISPYKNKYLGLSSGPSAVSELIDFKLYSKHTSIQMEDDKSSTNTAVDTLKDKINTSYLSPIKIHNETNVEIKKSIETQKEDQLLIKNKVQKLKNINFVYKDETFYLPVKQAANRNDMNNLNLNDTENEPPEKKKLGEFTVLQKRKIEASEQLNMQCKTDRAKLNGLDCWECREYYKNLSLSKEELQKRKNQCSRHRHKHERPNTPEGFWDPEFPETLSSTYRQNKN
ncbi:uncharacterized protein LOC105837271 isoform X2 [Monomorium pharaonis]|nr:uncharacterized protein LOC105837271 isoform X2 [Monomorium pharaonis]